MAYGARMVTLPSLDRSTMYTVAVSILARLAGGSLRLGNYGA